ncbi:hypothetical protein [Pyxidicoccus xibeiensis]|uniref:hypothetical protein n=1 Tax=Pyxidicoccus xibeiensis TaxID=2906759 RepID=UPI0020A7515E|nr:hypothetical protein [Pyxidicoccus xibeiensis]MCP3139354.1 hypothetical protein [Pyxidicoccus xibeiensis]
MNRTPASPRPRDRRVAPALLPGGLLLLGLLAWGGCSVEDPIAYILPPDSGTGSESLGDEGPDDTWAPQEVLAGGLPDCAEDSPDAGTGCEDAGTAEP